MIVVILDPKTIVIIAGPYEQLTPVAYSDNAGHFPLAVGLPLLGFGIGGIGFALGFAGSVGGDLAANEGDPASVNRGKAVAMGLVSFALGRAGGAGVQNKAKIGEALLRVSSSYKAVMTAAARHGAGPKFGSTWNLWGGRLLSDAALALPSILAGRMYSATSAMAYHTLITIAFSWAADSWVDWRWRSWLGQASLFPHS